MKKCRFKLVEYDKMNRMNTQHPVTAIIPAYNEADRILNVLRVLKDIHYIQNIIVIDDGSKDNTLEVVTSYIAEDPRVTLIRHEKNKGKGQSVYDAWEKISASYLLMLDADLFGLTPQLVDKLCKPVIDHQADMTLGVFANGKLTTDFSHWVTPWLSGQRCLRGYILGRISREAASGYGIETALTVAARQQHWRVVRVRLPGMSHPISEVHRGSFMNGFFHRLKMYAQIIRAWYIATSDRKVRREYSRK